MTITQLISDAIDLADEHTPRGETIEQARQRRALYVKEAIEKATGLSLSVDPAFVLDIPAPRPGPMFG